MGPQKPQSLPGGQKPQSLPAGFRASQKLQETRDSKASCKVSGHLKKSLAKTLRPWGGLEATSRSLSRDFRLLTEVWRPFPLGQGPLKDLTPP